MPRVAIFDLDGTLVDSAPAITRALNALRAERGLSALPVAQVRSWVSLGAAALVGRGVHGHRDASADEIAAFRQHYAQSPGQQEDLYPGIPAALAALHSAGVVMGVCTNKPQALSEQVLEATGIARFFRAVVGGDTPPRAKPDGAHVLHTLDAMACNGVIADFIGDSSVDARAAQASGARFLWASWGYADAPSLAMPQHTLQHPADIAPAILHKGQQA